MLLNVAISGDRNVMDREADQIHNCKDLIMEIQPMWNVKTEVIQAIVGVTRLISKSLRKYLNNIPGKHEIKELQKKTQSYWALHTYCGKC